MDIETDECVAHANRSRRYEVLNGDELNKGLDNMATDMTTKLDNIQFCKSGLSVDRILSIKFHYDKFNPTRAGRYIEFPKSISSIKACINIKNQDDLCFKYAVQCWVYKMEEKSHPEQMYHYKKLNDASADTSRGIRDTIWNWDGMRFPVHNEDIDYFEEISDGKVSTNVYEISEHLGQNYIIVNRKANHHTAKHHIDLLKIEEDDENHYVLIKDDDKLVWKQTNKHKAKVHHCNNGLHGFTTQANLTKHLKKGCMVEVGQQMEMSKEHKNIKFTHHFKKEKFPLVIYVDFECLTVPRNKNPDNEAKTDIYWPKPPRSQSETEIYQVHTPCGYMMNAVNSIENTSKQSLHRGEDCMVNFCLKPSVIRAEIEIIKYNEPIDMSEEDERHFQNATHCYVCGDKFKSTLKNLKDELYK